MAVSLVQSFPSGVDRPSVTRRDERRFDHRMRRGERLSWLSSGRWELGAHVACFGVEANEEFVGEGDTDHLFWLAGEGQSAVEGGEIGIVPAHELSDDEQDRADAAAPAADWAIAAELATIAGNRGEAGELADGLAGEGPDLGQLGHQARHRTIGNPFDLAPGEVELVPQRIGCD